MTHVYAGQLTRIFRRTSTDCLDYLSAGREWPNLRSVVRVTGHRETAAVVTVQPRCHISSLEAPAGRLLAADRRHWSLDVTFGEDQCWVRKDNGPQNMATLRQISHNLLKRETGLRAGIQGKRLQAGRREDYLPEVLRS